ncbi:MAG: hypothetical protein J6A83_08855 [Clostridia bacterium]|nr:hypothetical protein [Clostridia bacterium]
MARIGIVLAGGMSKGLYEVGCLQAIAKYFPKDDIKYISGTSIGVPTAYAFSSGKLDDVVRLWREIDVKQAGKFFPSFAGNANLLQKVGGLIGESDEMSCKMFGTVWNFTERKIEYIPFHKLSSSDRLDYMYASIAFPIFNKGVKINNCTMLDAAFIDDIPVYPLLEKNLDYIFCIYFEQKYYKFENDAFDRKVIKICHFPNKKMLDTLTFNPKLIDDMIKYGYDYTSSVIEKIFISDKKEEVYKAIKKVEAENESRAEPRLTADFVLLNIDKMTSRYVKRHMK